MKTVLMTVLTLLLAGSGLSAIGYKSAFVETDRAIEAAALEEDYYKSVGEYSGGSLESVSQNRSAATYDQARNLNLALPSLDPLSETTSKLIYGLMDMIVLRFKQQLFISSVSQWKDELLGSDIRYLFPNLAKLLNSTDSSNFLASYDLWRSAIERDLYESPLGILDYSLQVLQDDPKLSYEEKALLTELKCLMSDIYTFRNISSLNEFILVSTSADTQQSQLFRLIGVIAKNMLNEDGEIVADELKVKLADSYWREQYLAIIRQDINALSLNDDMFRVTSGNIDYYVDSCETVDNFFTQLEPESVESGTSRLSTSDYMQLYLSTCDNLLVQWSNMTSSSNNDWDEYYRYFTQYRFRLADISQQIEEKKYKAIINTIIGTAIDLAHDHNFIPQPYTRFLNLISTIALTGDYEDINYRQVMDSVLEPVGSYSYKRQSEFSVAINAYPGLGGGAETLNMQLKDAKAVAGLSCPIGLEMNWGHSLMGFSGVFFSAFDLGAVATYRFASTDTINSSSPQIGFKQLVSPGLYLLFQQEKHPITLGLGVQMTPELRKISDAGAVKGKNALRAGAFVSIDIPMFTFYVKHNWLASHRE